MQAYVIPKLQRKVVRSAVAPEGAQRAPDFADKVGESDFRRNFRRSTPMTRPPGIPPTWPTGFYANYLIRFKIFNLEVFHQVSQ